MWTLIDKMYTKVVRAASIAALLGGWACSSAFAACTPSCPPPPSAWAQLHADEKNASFNTNETTLSFNALQSMVPQAKYPQKIIGSAESVLATSGLVVVHYDFGLQVHSEGVGIFDAASAAVKWSTDIDDGPVFINSAADHYPAFAVAYGSRLYATKRTHDLPNSPAGGIWAYNAINGATSGAGLGYMPGSGLAFMSQVNTSAATPTITNAALYFARQDGGFSAVSTYTGAALWTLPPAANTLYLNQVAVADGRVYVLRQQNPGQLPVQTNTLLAVNAVTGASVWQHSFPGQNVVSAPAYYNGSLYLKVRTTGFVGMGQSANNIVRLDAATGNELANAVAAGINNLEGYDQSPTVGNGVLIAQGNSGSVLAPHTVIALDAVTLKKKWALTLNGARNGYAMDGLYDFRRAPSIANDFVLACSGGFLRAWQLGTGLGDQYFFNQAQLPCQGQPIVAGGRVIFSNPDLDVANLSYFVYAYGLP